MKRIFGALIFCLLLNVAAAEADLKALLEDAQKALGPLHTWSLEQKADFYNEHVYHHEGTRRGVPSSDVLSREDAIFCAQQGLMAYLNCGEDALEAFIVDVDYWIDAWPDEDREHEFYDIRFVQQTENGLRGRYQVILSPVTGNVIDLYDLDQLRQH